MPPLRKAAAGGVVDVSLLVLLTSHGAIDSDVLVGALALAFVTQTVLGWMKINSLEGMMKGLKADIRELQDIHPRQGNPGQRRHLRGDRHLDLERHRPQRSTKGR